MLFRSVCGACTVLLSGRMVASCITLAAQAAGAQVQTIEGLGDREVLDPLQESFIHDGGFQCGICTPGQLMAAKAIGPQAPSQMACHMEENSSRIRIHTTQS